MKKNINTPILEMINVSKSFKISKSLLQPKEYLMALLNINMKVFKSDIYSIIGQSGSGKSTLAKIITGIADCDSGEILFYNEKINKINTRQNIQMIFQNPYSSFNPRFKISECILEPLKYFKQMTKKNEISILRDYCSMLDLDKNLLDRLPHQLSGGQLQRVAIARALTTEPDVLVCDEITSALDSRTKLKILNLLEKINQNKSITIIFITHDIESAAFISNKIMVLKDGHVIEDGYAEEIICNPKSNYTKELIL